MSHQVVIVRTGIANLSSVVAGLERAGATTLVTEDVDVITRASHVMLPGVGAFKAAMQRLVALGVTDALRQRMSDDRPTMGICLGMQLLCKQSEESPGVDGLNVIPKDVQRFQNTKVRIPQLGWNMIRADKSCRYLRDGYAYFANSYRLGEAPEGWSAGIAEHGEPFVAACERGNILACQFHPELSGTWGLDLLRRWINGGDAC